MASEFTRIFLVTLAGFPVLVFVIDLVDNLRKYTERKLAYQAVAMSYLYWIPDTLFMVLPAAVLFATVFSIGTFTRYSEITAAKASGISFYRFIAPILLMATVAMGIGLVFSELAPPANAKRLKLLAGRSEFGETARYNFAFANDQGRVYRIYRSNPRRAHRAGRGRGARLDQARRTAHLRRQRPLDAGRGWMLGKGQLHVLPNDSIDLAFGFDSLIDRRLKETPDDLRARSASRRR